MKIWVALPSLRSGIRELSVPCDITKRLHTKLGCFSTWLMRGGASKAGKSVKDGQDGDRHSWLKKMG